MSKQRISRPTPNRRTATRWLAQMVLTIAAIVFTFPLVWMLLASFKPLPQLASDPFSIWPVRWAWENYRDAVLAMPFLTFLKNTLILCIGNVTGTLLSCSLVAYGFARLKWRGRNALFALLIATMLLPWHVTMIPRFLLLRELGLYNSLGAIIVPTFLGDAFYIFLLRQFFLTLPEDICEAARLDGLSEWGVFWRIVVPLSLPALATVGLFQFIATWNDFGSPLLLLSDPAKFPLAYGLEQFISSYSDQTHLLMAAAVLFTLPILILFLVTQRAFIQGVATTGIKG